jgi:hypothetical protein
LISAQNYAIVAAGVVALSSVAAAPIMSFIILGYVSPEVIQANAVLAFGWAINLFAVPLYIAAQGQGVLRWNIISHGTMAFFVVISTIFSSSLTMMPIIFGVSLALTVGSFVTILGNISLFKVSGFYQKFIINGSVSTAIITLFCLINYVLAIYYF